MHFLFVCLFSGMCELARSEEVEYVMNSRKSLKVRVRDMKSRDYHSNIGWLWTVRTPRRACVFLFNN